MLENDDLLNELDSLDFLAKGGLTKGKSHAKGGIELEVKSTGRKIEVEGGEGIINKYVMSDDELYEFEGKKKTACEIASTLNQTDGNGVKFSCEETEYTDMTPTNPHTGFAKGGDLSPEKAQEMLDDGYANGVDLTDKQKRYFHHVAKQSFDDGGVVSAATPSERYIITASNWKLSTVRLIVDGETFELGDFISCGDIVSLTEIDERYLSMPQDPNNDLSVGWLKIPRNFTKKISLSYARGGEIVDVDLNTQTEFVNTLASALNSNSSGETGSVIRNMYVEEKEKQNWALYKKLFNPVLDLITFGDKLELFHELIEDGNIDVISDELYEQKINSLAFNMWFGNWGQALETGNWGGVSKVFDYENKKPMIVWHGSVAQHYFYTFKFDEQRYLYGYFAKNPTYSDFFGNTGTGKYAFFLDIKNPIDFGALGLSVVTPEALVLYIEAAYGIVLDADKLMGGVDSPVRVWQYFRGEMNSDKYLLNTIKEAGFDGIIFFENNPSDIIDGKENTTEAYLTLYPEQAKLVHTHHFVNYLDSFLFNEGGEVPERENRVAIVTSPKDETDIYSISYRNEMWYESDEAFGESNGIDIGYHAENSFDVRYQVLDDITENHEEERFEYPETREGFIDALTKFQELIEKYNNMNDDKKEPYGYLSINKDVSQITMNEKDGRTGQLNEAETKDWFARLMPNITINIPEQTNLEDKEPNMFMGELDDSSTEEVVVYRLYPVDPKPKPKQELRDKYSTLLGYSSLEVYYESIQGEENFESELSFVSDDELELFVEVLGSAYDINTNVTKARADLISDN